MPERGLSHEQIAPPHTQESGDVRSSGPAAESVVSSAAVHRRLVSSDPKAGPRVEDREQEERKQKERALTDALDRYNDAYDSLEALFQAHPGTDSKVEFDGETVTIRIAAQEIDNDVRRTVIAYQEVEKGVDSPDYAVTLENISGATPELNELRSLFQEAISVQGTASAGSPENGGNTTEPIAPLPESGPDTEAESRFARIEGDFRKWQGIRGRITDLVKGTAFDEAMRSLPVPDFAKKHKEDGARGAINRWKRVSEQGRVPNEDLQSEIDALEQNLAKMIPAAEALLASLEAQRGKGSASSEPRDAAGKEGANGVPGPGLEAELQREWREMRGNSEAKIAAVESLLQEWKAAKQKISRFSDESRVRSDMVGSGLRPDTVRRILDGAEKDGEIEERLSVIRRNVEASSFLSDQDAGFLTAHFHGYHQLIAAAEAVIQERERETAVMAAEKEKPKAVDRTVESDGALPQEKLLRAAELLGQWDRLCDEVGARKLWRAIEKKHPRMRLPVVLDIKEWLDDHAEEKAWKGRWAERNRQYLNAHLRDLNGLVKDAELVATDIRSRAATGADQPAAPATEEAAEAPAVKNVTVFATGRKVESDEQMTAWENLVAKDARAFIQLINTTELNGFQSELKRKLAEKGITNSVDRLRVGRATLDRFMPGHIRKLAKQRNFEITDEEIEKVFMVGLRNNLFVS